MLANAAGIMRPFLPANAPTNRCGAGLDLPRAAQFVLRWVDLPPTSLPKSLQTESATLPPHTHLALGLHAPPGHGQRRHALKIIRIKIYEKNKN